MSERNISRFIHFASTSWLMLCIGYILVMALRQAGFRWWVIFSLSGYSALLIFLLISLYLFAIFRGIDRSQKVQTEHPLTTTTYYTVFYDISPFLGGLSGCLAMAGVGKAGEFPPGIALGTFATTFLVWIVVDPVVGLVEKLLPASRSHRIERLALAKALRQKRQEEQKLLLEAILAKEQQEQSLWQQVLEPQAEKLAMLLCKQEIGNKQTENEVVNIGANAWQTGGLNCMRKLHSMAMEICRRKYQNLMIIDCISAWWDGIGGWRTQSFN